MKRIYVLLVYSLQLLASTTLFGQSQQAINQAEARTLQQADRELNSVYQRILKQYSSDQEFVKNLKTAQRIWIMARDADVKMKYPDRPAGYYGSIQPMCEATYRTELTQQRTKMLSVWLTGIEEGDACAGSVKIRN